MIPIDTVRNVLVFREGNIAFVSAVDSCGGIGTLPGDTLAADPEIVGACTARTPLLEVLATGAPAVFASVSVSNSLQYAQSILKGVRGVLGDAVALIVSTEKNMPTAMTAVGVTVTGTCPVQELRLGGPHAGDVLYCAGLPLVGAEVLESGGLIPAPADIRSLMQNPGVHAVIPVGSKGVAAEARVLASESGRKVTLYENTGIDLYKSGGPSSCVVVAAQAGTRPFGPDLPVTKIGTVY